MKVMYIYRWVNKRAPDCTYDVITDLRRIYKLRKNTDRVDMIFRHMQAVNSAHLAAPASARPPQQQSKYYAGWKIGWYTKGRNTNKKRTWILQPPVPI